MNVAGVDGCRGGWVVVTGDGGPPMEWDVVLTWDAFIQARPEVGLTVGMDMPIGLPETPPRTCDVEARRLLAEARSSLFPVCSRFVLEADEHREACARAVSRGESKPSIQLWNLRSKIFEVERQLELAQSKHISVNEVHPELAFRLLAKGKGIALEPKKAASGRQQRICLLEGLWPEWSFEQFLRQRLKGEGRPGRAPLIDLLDACIAYQAATRIAQGVAEPLGLGERDGRGIPMTIWI